MEYSAEQRSNIVAVKYNQLVSITATAGAGKSTQLFGIAKSFPRAKFLYSAFNKLIVADAEKKRVPNVQAKTFHAVAFKYFGFKYKQKLWHNNGEEYCYYPNDVVKFFKLKDEFKGHNAVLVAKFVLNVVNLFEMSGYDKLTDFITVNLDSYIESISHDGKFCGVGRDTIKSKICKCAIQLWNKRIDLKDKTNVTHNTYLKLLQLSKTVLDFDCILLDESQDVNPVVAEIIATQLNGGKKVVLVGDDQQAIYKFNGCINASEYLSSYKPYKCKLSTSYRFGKNIAELANLASSTGFDTNVLSDKKDFVNEYKFNSNTIDSYTIDNSNLILFRSNAHLLKDAYDMVIAGKEIAITTDIKETTLAIASIKSLSSNSKYGAKNVIHSSKIKCYANYNELKEAAVYDKELAMLITLTASIGTQLLQTFVGWVNPTNPKYTLSTVHSTKGTEFTTVFLNMNPITDFEDFEFTNYRSISLELKEELNILFVAITRSKGRLFVNEELYKSKDNLFCKLPKQVKEDDWC